MSADLTDAQQRILWTAIAGAYDDWVPLEEFYAAAKVCLGSDRFDADLVLGNIVGYVARRGIALAGEVTSEDGFIPWPLSREKQEARLRSYVKNTPAWRSDAYDIWFVVSAWGGQLMLDYWAEHPDSR